MLLEPLSRKDAKALIRAILRSGIVTYARPHALERMAKRAISTVDCENVLYGGVVHDPELENGTWRYRVETRKMCVVIRFEDDTVLQIVTAWRN
ncbi:hypothetical protein GMSM_25720 [Geomonas sp. Red276]